MHRRINAPRIRRLTWQTYKRLLIKTLQRITCVERFYFDSGVGGFLARRVFIALVFYVHTCRKGYEFGCLAATTEISTSHSGRASAGTVTSVLAARCPDSARSRSAITIFN